MSRFEPANDDGKITRVAPLIAPLPEWIQREADQIIRQRRRNAVKDFVASAVLIAAIGLGVAWVIAQFVPLP